MPRKLLISSGLGWLIAAGSACTAPEPGAVGSFSQPILYGELSGPEDDGVVMIAAQSSVGVWNCSATLVAPNLVVTARHCISNFVNAEFTCTPTGELESGSEGGQIGAAIAPDKITVKLGQVPGATVAARGLETFLVDTTSICRNDIAAVLLDEAITAVPIFPVRVGRGTQRGEQIRVVGYGTNEDGLFGTRHTRSGLTIAEVGTSQFLREGDAVPARTFVTKGPALCGGDSGGPALSEQGAVIGVYSQVVGDCTALSARNYFTELAPFESDLLVPAFAAAGADPLPEFPEPGSAGAAGTGNVVASAGQAGSPGAPPLSAGSSGSPEPPGGTGGASSTPGRAGSAGTAETEPPTAGAAGAAETPTKPSGLRKKGGCTCRSVGGPALPGGAWSALLGALALGWGRRRQTRSRLQNDSPFAGRRARAPIPPPPYREPMP